MKKHNLIIITCALLLLSGCASRGRQARQTPMTKTSYTIKETLRQARLGIQSGPLCLTYRKLQVNEITEYLDIDEETTILYLNTSNIHGYFSLLAKNYPPGMEFVLYHADISGKLTSTKCYFVNERGVLLTRMDDTCIPLENNFLFFSNYLPGEPADFVLASKDGKYCAATRIIPNPIEAIDEAKRRVSVEIASPNKRQYIVHCSGFEPFGSYMLITRFENEKYLHNLEADCNGEMFQTTGPTLPWVCNGEGSIEIRGGGISSPITLEFQWGG